MRNKYPGRCYFCGKTVAKGEGHFERNNRSWRTIHAACVFRLREQKSAEKRSDEPKDTRFSENLY